MMFFVLAGIEQDFCQMLTMLTAAAGTGYILGTGPGTAKGTGTN